MKTNKLFIFIAACYIFLSGCGNKNNFPELSDILIQESIQNTLKTEEMISFDKMSDFQFTEVEVNDFDMETLKSKFPSKVEFKKFESSFTLVSVSLDIKANYSSVFVYNNGEWKLSFGYPTDKDAWEYTGKQTVNMQRMLDDLKTTDFDSFSTGYVGDSKYSSLKIEERNTDMSINRDNVSVLVNVKTDFAEYEIPVDIVYYFNKGEWVLGDVTVSDSSQWKLTYNDGRAPTFMTDNEVLSYLTVDTNFLTYVANLGFVEDFSIEKISEKATKDSVIAEYRFNTRYDYIGTMSYSAYAEYEWMDGEWGEPEVSVEPYEADFSEMIKYEWKNDSGNVFTFEEITYDEETGMYLITGKYNSVPLVLNISIVLRDNNWDAKLLNSEGMEILDIPTSVLSLNLEYSAILYNNLLFSPAEIVMEEETPEQEAIINTSNDIVITGISQEQFFDNVISKDGLTFKDIVLAPDMDTGVITIKGTISNTSGAMSGYRITAAAYSADGTLLSEGLLKSESQLTTDSSAVVEFSMDAMDLTQAEKLTIYTRS